MIKKRFSALCGALLLFSASVQALNETLIVDMSDPIGPVTQAASGALYGITESLPTDINGLVAPLNPRMYTQPARSGPGYQQQIGAAIPVSQRLANTTAEVTVRLADILPGWPYQWSGWSHWSTEVRSVIADKRSSGRNNYYGYEIFNEPNITWNDANGNFNSSLWKPTYDLIRSQDPGERIIGPSAAWYDRTYIQNFLAYCVTNSCLPDVISWHELGGSDNITANIADYRARESALGISPRPISINEYSHDTHEYEGAPGVSVPFIAKFERNRVESANISWWFTNLPGRLGSLLTANNQRGGGWWLYKWYGDMTGNMLSVTPPRQNGDGLDGFANLDTSAGYASICLGGNFTGTANVVFNNIPASFGDVVDVTVEYVSWSNKDTPVSGPVTVAQSVETVVNGSLTVPVTVTNPFYGYRVIINGQGFGSEGSSVQVELESLSNQQSFAPFSVLSDAAASGSQYIVWPNNGDQLLDSASDDASGQVLIPFSLSQSTAVQLQIRVNMPNANDDSFYFKLDDGTWTTQNNTQTSGWSTLTLATFDNLAAGDHTLRIERREDGAKLDFITLLTAAGDIETSSSGGSSGDSCDGINVYPNWTARDWSGGAYNHANAGDQMVYQNTLYQANWYTNTVPGSDSSWSLIGNCDQMTSS
ncbi:cellulose-binding domain-containing protein [Gynuella sunshinyii]|uniref:Chitin-binding type-3 domain-containing protein n=1 Tax=Gynuella sunshinyii YC6258 TaxID=1445510 RepID=A0A0C5VMS6_9GAMM|nr:cellulose-binding domain-containing protein [Gynuella sunshinyii]AJQ95611.1 hypothetical Protein YC6258_03575 [Gynuella sunshinyii YC6258]